MQPKKVYNRRTPYYHWCSIVFSITFGLSLSRCLNPGKYAQHLERWMSYFTPQSLHIIDGEELKTNPVEVMNELQKFLKITPFFNYTEHLRYLQFLLYIAGCIFSAYLEIPFVVSDLI